MGRKKSPEKLALEIEECKWAEALRHLPYCPEPTYQFEVDQSLKLGFLENCVIIGKYFDGKIYKIEFDQHVRDSAYRKTEETYRDYNYFCWYQLRPEVDNKESFIENEDVRIHYMHMMIDSIFSKKYFFGIDMDPDYQRGYE